MEGVQCWHWWRWNEVDRSFILELPALMWLRFSVPMSVASTTSHTWAPLLHPLLCFKPQFTTDILNYPASAYYILFQKVNKWAARPIIISWLVFSPLAWEEWLVLLQAAIHFSMFLFSFSLCLSFSLLFIFSCSLYLSVAMDYKLWTIFLLQGR